MGRERAAALNDPGRAFRMNFSRWRDSVAAVRESRPSKILLGILGILGIWSTVGAQLVPPSWRERWPTAYDFFVTGLGYIPWWVWLIGGALVVVVSSLMYAGHHKRRADGLAGITPGSIIDPPTVTQKPPSPEQIRVRAAAQGSQGWRRTSEREDKERWRIRGLVQPSPPFHASIMQVIR